MGVGYTGSSLSVCVLPQNQCLNSIISKSKGATALKLGSHIYTKRGSLQDRKVLYGEGSSNLK